MDISACNIETEELLERLKTNTKDGLSAERAERRRENVEENVFETRGRRTLFDSLKGQFMSPLVLVLFAAGIATLFLGEYIDTIVIFVALVINVGIGVFQEERASRAFEKLQESQERYATVIRDGSRQVVEAAKLVPGDIVFIESGANVPADLRLTETKELTTNESALTGEWVDVSKEPGVCKEDTPVTGQFNMAWMGTLVTNGFGYGVVVATGADTQIGEIAESLQTIEDENTPLQKSIRRIAQFLVAAIIAAIVLIFVLGLARGEPVGEMILIAIAIAVAAIPQGLPAAVTVVLALGMESILKRGGLVRNLLAAETLGATTVILTDKTGTLTQAKMGLANILTCSHLDRNGTKDDSDGAPAELEEDIVLKTAVAASDAFFEEKNGERIAHGRPLGKAVIKRGAEEGIFQEDITKEEERLDFLPFESDIGFEASLHRRIGKKNRIYISGIPEKLIEQAQYIHCGSTIEAFTEEKRQTLRNAQREASDAGFRLIGTAYVETSKKQFSDIPSEEIEDALVKDGIILAGLLVFEDPVRTDVAEAITTVKQAGADVLMLTGDNAATAATVAEAVGISQPGGVVLEGVDIDAMDDEELYTQLKTTRVFARALPRQKLRIARLLKNKGEVVAMTGDGVNDAPALRSANIGVAVEAGTEVAKEASDLVLLGNSFSIIVAAIEEGRKIVDNLKKIIAYLLSTSFSEIALIGGALAFGAPLPILPTQILWANIVEEGLMSFSFAFERPEKGIMKRDPRSARARQVLTPDLRKMIAILAIVTGAFLLVLYAVLLRMDIPIDKIRTIMFVAVSADSIFFAFSLKSLRKPLWRISIFTNRYLLIAVAASLLLLFAAITLPLFQTLLSTVPLSGIEWLILVGIGLVNLLFIEVAKYFVFERKTDGKAGE